MLHRFALVLLVLPLVGCERTSPAPAPATEEAAVEMRGTSPGPPPYTIDVTGFEGPMDTEGYVVVSIETKNGHKINKSYPHKVVLDAPPAGLDLPMRTMKLADAEIDGDKRLVYSIPAVGARAGEYTLNGTIRLSVCNDDQCRIEKEKMSARVVVQ